MSNATLTARSIDDLTATSQVSTPSANFLPIGLDVGNGAVKLFSSLGETLMESYVLYLSERATHANAGYVEYLEGSRSDLSGKQ